SQNRNVCSPGYCLFHSYHTDRGKTRRIQLNLVDKPCCRGIVTRCLLFYAVGKPGRNRCGDCLSIWTICAWAALACFNRSLFWRRGETRILTVHLIHVL